MPKFNSKGEEIVYRRLQNDPGCKSFISIHSLFIFRHLRQITGEIDFIVMVPDHGIFCLEVKHGGVERDARGIWKFKDRNGNVTLNDKGPFRQVNDGVNSLRGDIINQLTIHHPEIRNRFSKKVFGTGVMFTSMEEFEITGTEGESWQVFTKPDLYNDLSLYIMQLSQNWHAKFAATETCREWYHPQTSRPTKEDCELLYKLLRRDFSFNYSLLNRISDDEDSITTLTNEQFESLESVEENPRTLIKGGAGTGKTILALETARRKIEEGCKVGLFCFNEKLGHSLSEKIHLLTENFTEGSFAGHISKYLINNSDNLQHETFDDHFFNVVLPGHFYLKNDFTEEQKFDFLIVDEAQDLITNEYLRVFNSILKNGLTGGRWVMLGDFSHQAIFNVSDPGESINLLTSVANYANFRLKYNCRNPKRVNSFNVLITGCENIKSREGMPDGETFTHFTGGIYETAEKILSIIRELNSNGVPYEKITILTPKTLENSNLNRSPGIIDLINKEGLIYSTIQAYKGLENSAVIVAGFDELTSPQALRLMYIAVSRAKFRLYVVLSRALKPAYENNLRTNMPKITNI